MRVYPSRYTVFSKQEISAVDTIKSMINNLEYVESIVLPYGIFSPLLTSEQIRKWINRKFYELSIHYSPHLNAYGILIDYGLQSLFRKLLNELAISYEYPVKEIWFSKVDVAVVLDYYELDRVSLDKLTALKTNVANPICNAFGYKLRDVTIKDNKVVFFGYR